MSMAEANPPISKAQDKCNAVQAARQTLEDNWRGFLQQTDNLLREAQKTLQNCGQKQQDFGTKLDQELQTLEQEIGKNSGFVASLSAGGILAKQELVAQKRVSLLQGLKQEQESLGQLDQQLSAVIDHLAQGFQQLQQHSDPVRTNLQDLSTELGHLDQEFKNLKSQTQAAPVRLAPTTSNGVDTEVLTKLGQAEVALLALKQGLEKSRLMQQVLSNLSEVQQRHHLH